jgi:hypothetical protein
MLKIIRSFLSMISLQSKISNLFLWSSNSIVCLCFRCCEKQRKCLIKVPNKPHEDCHLKSHYISTVWIIHRQTKLWKTLRLLALQLLWTLPPGTGFLLLTVGGTMWIACPPQPDSNSRIATASCSSMRGVSKLCTQRLASPFHNLMRPVFQCLT